MKTSLWYFVCFFDVVVPGLGIYLTPVNTSVNIYPWRNESRIQIVRARLSREEWGEVKFYVHLQRGNRSQCPDLEVVQDDFAGVVEMKHNPVVHNTIPQAEFACSYTVEAVLIATRNDIVSKSSHRSRAESQLHVVIFPIMTDKIDSHKCGNTLNQEFACFGGVTHLVAQVLENSMRADVASLGFHNRKCFDLTYTIFLPGPEIKGVANFKPGSRFAHWAADLYARSELDREMQNHYSFNVTCYVKILQDNGIKDSPVKPYTIPMQMVVLDENDNVPLTQLNTTQMTVFYELDKIGARLIQGARLEPDRGHAELSIWDKDSLPVNDFHVNVLNDTKGLIDVRISSNVYLKLLNDLPPVTFLLLKTVWRQNKVIVFDGIYCVLVVVNDNTVVPSVLRNKEAKIRITVCLYYASRRELPDATVQETLVQANSPLSWDGEINSNNVINKSAVVLASAALIHTREGQCDTNCLMAVMIVLITAVFVLVLGLTFKNRDISRAYIAHFSRRSSRAYVNPVKGNGAELSEEVEYNDVTPPSELETPGKKCEDSLRFVNECPYSAPPLANEMWKNMSVDPQWEIPRSTISVSDVLGEGEFGRVLKGQMKADSGTLDVAVKILKHKGGEGIGAMYHNEFLAEFFSLKETSHLNIIKLHGICTTGSDPYYLVMEYAEYGSLKAFLNKCRKLRELRESSFAVRSLNCCNFGDNLEDSAYTLNCTDMLTFALQIAKGMAYLSRLKIIHRDLAARNVLVTTGKVCKISDFGLSRDVYLDDKYVKVSAGKVPIKWLSMESLKSGLYTIGSDVWSFGVVMWELSSVGLNPYPGIPPNQMYPLLKTGYRMPSPLDCPPELYTLMSKCWKEEPSSRPTFRECEFCLLELLMVTPDYQEENERKGLKDKSPSITSIHDEVSLGENFVVNPEYDYSISSSSQSSTDEYGGSSDVFYIRRRALSYPPGNLVNGSLACMSHSLSSFRFPPVVEAMKSRKENHLHGKHCCNCSFRAKSNLYQNV